MSGTEPPVDPSRHGEQAVADAVDGTAGGTSGRAVDEVEEDVGPTGGEESGGVHTLLEGDDPVAAPRVDGKESTYAPTVAVGRAQGSPKREVCRDATGTAPDHVVKESPVPPVPALVTKLAGSSNRDPGALWEGPGTPT